MDMHCCYRTCTSDSRYNHREYMKYVKFVCFPKPYLISNEKKDINQFAKKNKMKSANDGYICGQLTSGQNAFTMKNITRGTYM